MGAFTLSDGKSLGPWRSADGASFLPPPWQGSPVEVEESDLSGVLLPRRVLVLDDEPDIGATIALIARKAGFLVELARDSIAFFESLRRFRPDIVILDLMMPDRDGLDILHLLQGSGHRPAIIMSSGAGQRMLASAERLGVALNLPMVGMLPKPFSPARLRKLLSDAASTKDMAAPLPPPSSFGESVTVERMAAARAAGELYPVFQPIADMKRQTLVGFEVLCRWTLADGKSVAPDLFIPKAEASGAIGLITDHITSCALTAFTRSPVLRGLDLSLNLSPALLRDPDLPHRLAAACARRNMPPERVILEITETAQPPDLPSLLTALTRLKLAGFQLALDDFGLGYSTISHLAQMPYDKIKIDKSFVQALATCRKTQGIVHSMIDLAHRLDIDVIAEGVETQEALSFLLGAGCRLVQGYLIAMPETEERLAGTAASQSWLATLLRDARAAEPD